jgi:DNA-binding CsgD family transcriptional regulator
MGKTTEASRHLFLIAAQAQAKALSTAKGHADAASFAPRETTPAREMIIDGRRYRLVPAETAEPARQERRPRAALAQMLTARELQIAALVAEGRINKQIAAELEISEWTVSTHLRRIFAKLDVDTRAAMVTKCFDALTSRGDE